MGKKMETATALNVKTQEDRRIKSTLLKVANMDKTVVGIANLG